jgi:hypothetical protein
LDVDYGSASAETGAAYLGMLAVDSLLGIVAAVEKLTDIAVEGAPAAPVAPAAELQQQQQQSRDPVESGTCQAMVRLSWRTVLSALSQLLTHTTGEALIVPLLKVSQLVHSANFHKMAVLLMTLHQTCPSLFPCAISALMLSSQHLT